MANSSSLPQAFSMLRIWVEGCENFPSSPFTEGRGLHVKVVERPPGAANKPSEDPSLPIPAAFEFSGGVQDEDSVQFIPKRFFQTDLRPQWQLLFNVCNDWGTVLGYAIIEATDLAKGEAHRLLLQHPVTHQPLYARDRPGKIYTGPFSEDFDGHTSRLLGERRRKVARRPSFLDLAVQVAAPSPSTRVLPEPNLVCESLTAGSSFRRRRRTDGRTRVLILTRGTRGDVQPFVALARGLILHHHCEVTICTELVWKKFVKSFRFGLPEGTLMFRPSGGDTMAQTREAISQLITWNGQHYDFLQSLIFSAQETNFFPSEGCCFHWALEERPDFIVFGFTMCHVGMVVGEALGIPIVAFLLQPDHKIEERRDVSTALDTLLGPSRQAINSEGFNAVLMQIFERMGAGGNISVNKLRTTRGLRTVPSGLSDSMEHFEEMQLQNVPIVVPISPIALGEYIEKLPPYIFTDFIYLRVGEEPLDADVMSFIQAAKKVGRSIVLMTFSSMPVGARIMLEMAVEACKSPALRSTKPGQASIGPAMIVITAGQEHDSPPPRLTEEVEALNHEGRLLELKKGVPFGSLFPLLDVVIGQGGLGVTSDALRAGIPIITSGILLLDQRWWAARVHELGVGSKPVKVDRLAMWDSVSGTSRLVRFLSKALSTSQPSLPDVTQRFDSCGLSWSEKAAQVSKELKEGSRDDPDGVLRNAKAVFESGTSNAAVLVDAYSENRGPCPCFCRQARCCYRCTQTFLRFFFLLNLPTLFYGIVLILAECVCCGPCRRRYKYYCYKKSDPSLNSSEESTEEESEFDNLSVSSEEESMDEEMN